MQRISKLVRGAIACALLVCPLPALAQFGGGQAPQQSVRERFLASVEDVSHLMGGNRSENDGGSRCHCAGEAGNKSVQRILEVLDSPLTSAGIEFTDQPLEEVLVQLQDDYDIPIQLDLPALDNAGMSPQENLTISIRGMSLRSALNLMMRRLQLTYVIEDEVLMITTPEEAEAQLTVCVYDVGDLIDGPQAVRPLIEVLICCVASDTWAANGGGDAEIQPLPPDLLVISQTRAVHDKIGDLLAAIRAARSSGSVDAAEPAVVDPAAEGEADHLKAAE